MPLDVSYLPPRPPREGLLPEPRRQGTWPHPHRDSWWGRTVRTQDGRVGVSESNPDPAGPYFLVYVRFADGRGEWFRQATLMRV